MLNTDSCNRKLVYHSTCGRQAKTVQSVTARELSTGNSQHINKLNESWVRPSLAWYHARHEPATFATLLNDIQTVYKCDKQNTANFAQLAKYYQRVVGGTMLTFLGGPQLWRCHQHTNNILRDLKNFQKGKRNVVQPSKILGGRKAIGHLCQPTLLSIVNETHWIQTMFSEILTADNITSTDASAIDNNQLECKTNKSYWYAASHSLPSMPTSSSSSVTAVTVSSCNRNMTRQITKQHKDYRLTHAWTKIHLISITITSMFLIITIITTIITRTVP